MKNISYCVVIAAALFVAAAGAARADCGAHQMAANAVKLLATERMSLTLANVYNDDNWGDAPRVAAANPLAYPKNPCPEDSAQSQRAQSVIISLWTSALMLQNEVAVHHFAARGLIEDPAPCVAQYLAMMRSHFLNTWWEQTTTPFDGNPDPEFARALAKTRYFSHVKSLWQTLGRELGVPLPPAGSEMRKQVDVLDAARRIIDAHMPDGINCRSLPN